MSMVKWNPLHEFLRLRNLFNEVFDRTFQAQVANHEMGSHAWSPVVDVYKNNRELTVVAEIPGIEKKDIQIEYSNNLLTIKGNRPASYNNGEVVLHRLERQHGFFKRDVNIPPVVVDQTKIEASYDAGVLRIVLPLSNNETAKKIPI